MPRYIDRKTHEDVERFVETFAKLPPQAQKEVAIFAVAAKAIYETKEINEGSERGEVVVNA